MSTRLGQVLIGKGVLTPERLKLALDNQLIYGGHLGTCLVELGFLGVDQLARVLGEQFQIHHAERDWLENIRPEVISTLPPKLVERHKAVPFTIAGRALRVAMIDPADLLALDELSFAAGYKIEPWIAPELVVMRALERHYGLPRKLRHIPVSPAKAPGSVATAPPPPPVASPAAPPVERRTVSTPPKSSARSEPASPVRKADEIRAELLRAVVRREAGAADPESATSGRGAPDAASAQAGEYVPQTIPKAAERAHYGKGELRIDWIKQKKEGREVWCDLFWTPLEHPHFDGLEGVYVIWHHGRNPVLRVGRGVIRDELGQAREDAGLQEIGQEQSVYVTWATVPPGSETNVERYLIESLSPQVTVKLPEASPVAVNLPR